MDTIKNGQPGMHTIKNGQFRMDNQEWTIKNGQSRMGNQEWATKNGQSRMDNQEWTQSRMGNPQKTKKMNNTDPTKNLG